MNKYLILSSTLDFSTDYVCVEMEKRGLDYLRINRDQLSDYKVVYDVQKKELHISYHDMIHRITDDNLKAVFFRAPVFIRSNKVYSLEDQLRRSQWSSFIRNLTVFSSAKWLNHPMFTYQAENKIYQLDVAKNVGLEIPETLISNSADGILKNETYVIKALDTPLFYENGQEMFTYTTVISGANISSSSLHIAPVIIQKCINDKVDLRVTVVGDEIYPATITTHNNGIYGDWRKLKKEDLQYNRTELPIEIKEKLLKLMQEMNLSFGGVDLAFANGTYYFIEINPTGEWGWLIPTTGYQIQEAIVDWMVQ